MLKLRSEYKKKIHFLTFQIEFMNVKLLKKRLNNI